jgi:hypothetical protein
MAEKLDEKLLSSGVQQVCSNGVSRGARCTLHASLIDPGTFMPKSAMTPDFFSRRILGCLPAHLGIKILFVGDGELTAELEVAAHLLAPNGYLHAGSVVTLADTAAGYGWHR